VDLKDFDRHDVLTAVLGLSASPDPTIAQAAIGLIGSHNPYMTEERIPFWLGTVGQANPGLAQMDPKMKNEGGELYWSDLVAVADGKADGRRGHSRLGAGLVRKPELQEPIKRWLLDPASSVRSAAIVLLADIPGQSTTGKLASLVDDPDAGVRAQWPARSGWPAESNRLPSWQS